VGGSPAFKFAIDIRSWLPKQVAALQKLEIRAGTNTKGDGLFTFAVNVNGVESRTTIDFATGEVEQQFGAEIKLATVTVCGFKAAELKLKLRPLNFGYASQSGLEFGYKVGLQAKINIPGAPNGAFLIDIPLVGGGLIGGGTD
jgi:hypothetical protein